MAAPEGHLLVDEFAERLLFSPVEHDAVFRDPPRVAPHLDLALAAPPDVRHNSIEELHRCHVIHFSQHPKGRAPPFSVSKRRKEQFRLAMACCLPYLRYRAPPAWPSGGADSWASARVPHGRDWFMAQADAQVFFYRCRVASLSGRMFLLPAGQSWMMRKSVGNLASDKVSFGVVVDGRGGERQAFGETLAKRLRRIAVS